MLGFPKPYSDELLYSTVARAGVHDGETSPKQLLDQVFENRKIIATVDLPSHVQSLAQQYPSNSGLNTSLLIARHTLWPIYAPFLPPERIKKLRNWMAEQSQGAAHLASGIAASRVKAKTELFACRPCLAEQRLKYGECYWHRLWQVPLVRMCPKHGALSRSNIELDGEHRHAFIPVESADLFQDVLVKEQDEVFAKQCAQLLLSNCEGISFAQWSLFYKQFAVSLNYLDGSRIDHSKIHDTVVTFWGKQWLEDVRILPSRIETSWLKSLFRKHRKSFSFAEHIVAIVALSDGRLSISEAINQASSLIISAAETKNQSAQKHDVEPVAPPSPDQLQWKTLLKSYSPKAARQIYKALYARLYRNNYEWLMEIDKSFHTETTLKNHRVDWSKRDRKIARELRRVCKALTENLNAPHLSRTFLIHQLNQRATVEKNLSRLPRCAMLLTLYSESTTEYQARRLTRAYLSMRNKHREIKRWSLLREAGLSDERMTELITALLKDILSE
ncbi:MAG: TnsD family Tn7-like transposition protein [Cellvibrionaceae bacterium]|uniref:TnsD family Tn7-like transposition protein n=2 Tax=Spongiibacteraceae TaxID=1706375 RepID=A0A9J6RIY8_9GAMM|nr:TnsD family Tn7-like transposition protein [Dasania phycosphaerae]MCR8921960.1 TnsD family transposase [Dasania sp. GY-MA-18]MCZ0864388.1 TnsD family Tn7-like transposition protein [Dasania phycosphaerae]MCZ0868116.1 TnsD family Tn7-like transposition protein [Dasania phycosphaerae]